ncbi:hypothetical protein TNCV_2845231 [Trichonephila clavipes]|nr:hypothetical protein TNCV_2845231 [Trichonephila clavipes]
MPDMIRYLDHWATAAPGGLGSNRVQSRIYPDSRRDDAAQIASLWDNDIFPLSNEMFDRNNGTEGSGLQ